MPDTRWKRHERQVAAVLGGARVRHRQRPPIDPDLPPISRLFRLSSAASRPRPQVVCGPWELQVRLRTPLPGWLSGAMDDARRAASRHGRPGVVLVSASQGVPADRWVMVPLCEFKGLLDRAGELPEEASDDESTPRAERHVSPLDEEELALKRQFYRSFVTYFSRELSE